MQSLTHVFIVVKMKVYLKLRSSLSALQIVLDLIEDAGDQQFVDEDLTLETNG